jgi:predicted kinase
VANAEAEVEPSKRRSQRLSYGVALGLGRNMANDGMSVDVDAFAARPARRHERRAAASDDEEIQAEMMAFQERMTPSARQRRSHGRPTRSAAAFSPRTARVKV